MYLKFPRCVNRRSSRVLRVLITLSAKTDFSLLNVWKRVIFSRFKRSLNTEFLYSSPWSVHRYIGFLLLLFSTFLNARVISGPDLVLIGTVKSVFEKEQIIIKMNLKPRFSA